jgi:hypothetical protein
VKVVPVQAPVRVPVRVPIKVPVRAPVKAPPNACTFTIGQAFGDSFAIDITVSITPLSNNGGVKLTVTESDADSIGDLRGLFFDVNKSFHLGAPSAITGTKVTDKQVVDNGVIDLGNGANMKGNGNKNYDVGAEIGTQGIGHDDIQTTVIDVAWPGLTLASLCDQAVGVRLTSSGHSGSSRAYSSKIFGKSCACVA